MTWTSLLSAASILEFGGKTGMNFPADGATYKWTWLQVAGKGNNEKCLVSYSYW